MGRSRHEELLGIVHAARRRLRIRQLLHGASVVALAAALLLLVASFGVDQLRFSPWAVIVFRTLVIAGPLALAAWLIARPLLSPVSDSRIALYLEEHAPAHRDLHPIGRKVLQNRRHLEIAPARHHRVSRAHVNTIRIPLAAAPRHQPSHASPHRAGPHQQEGGAHQHGAGQDAAGANHGRLLDAPAVVDRLAALHRVRHQPIHQRRRSGRLPPAPDVLHRAQHASLERRGVLFEIQRDARVRDGRK